MANTIGDKLALAATNKTNIKQAIIDKGAIIAPTNVMSQWPTAIRSIADVRVEAATGKLYTSVDKINY